MHFQEPNCHVNQIRLVAIRHRNLNDLVQFFVLRFNEIEPRDIDILQRPGVLELCPCGFTAYGRGIIRIGIEGRIEINEIDRV